jgi:hypothetical protein
LNGKGNLVTHLAGDGKAASKNAAGDELANGPTQVHVGGQVATQIGGADLGSWRVLESDVLTEAVPWLASRLHSPYAGLRVAKTPHDNPHRIWPPIKAPALGAKKTAKIAAFRKPMDTIITQR